MDKPKNTTENKTTQNIYPVIANGLQNDGIVGFTSSYTVSEKCLTISGRGTIGFPTIRDFPFTPIVRLLVIKPYLNYMSAEYLSYTLALKCNEGIGTSIKQLTVPMIINIPIEVPPLKEQVKIANKIEKIFNTIKSF